jgi:hypothetical protein
MIQKSINKKVHPLLIGVAGLATVGAIYGVYHFFFRKKEASFSIGGLGNTGVSSLCKHKDYPVRLGSCGNYVKPLQCYLNRKGSELIVDGKFGDKTKTAALKWLKKDEFDKIFMNEFNRYWDEKNIKCN